MDAIPGNPRPIRFARQDRAHLLRRGATGECDEGGPAFGNRLFDRTREVFGCRPGQRRPIGNDDHLPALPKVERQALAVLPSCCLAVLPTSIVFHHRGLAPVKPSGAMSAAKANAASKMASWPKTRNSSPKRSASVG